MLPPICFPQQVSSQRFEVPYQDSTSDCFKHRHLRHFGKCCQNGRSVRFSGRRTQGSHRRLFSGCMVSPLLETWLLNAMLTLYPCRTTKVEAMLAITRLATYHPSILQRELHTIVQALVYEVKNLRSTVSRSAIYTLGDLLTKMKQINRTTHRYDCTSVTAQMFREYDVHSR